MKKLIALFAFVALNSSAYELRSDVKIVPVNQDAATQLCVTSATQGYAAAKTLAMSLDKNAREMLLLTTCNGISVKRFAMKYQAETKQSVDVQKVFKFVPSTQDSASKLCALAANDGYKKAEEVGGRVTKQLICNGRTIEQFAKKYNQL